MLDFAHKQTDEIIEDLEKKLQKEYSQAYKEIDKKAEEYFAKFEKQDKKWQELVRKGERTQKQYQAWQRDEVIKGQRWTALRDQIAEDLTHTNQIAANMVKNEMYGVFALNGNYTSYTIENGFRNDYGFTLYSRDAVERLIKDEPDLLPLPSVDVKKDLLWNRQQITSHITQGILQGESIPNLSKRLIQTVGNNKASAVRTARTAITSAENGGRQASYNRAKAMGIKVKKQWMATIDGRTRHEHGQADGQEVDVDKPFDVGGEKLMFPGDMSGSPENVYNCRCTMVTVEPPEILQGDGERMTYSEWVKRK